MQNLIRSSLIFLSIISLNSCTKNPSNETYTVGEIGVSRDVAFGTIINTRPVDIAPHATGAGALLGAGAAGGGASYIGNGSGQTWATVGGAIAGAVIGNAIEQELNKTSGVEYVIAMRDGSTKTIVQEVSDENPVLASGDKVMLQYCDAGEHERKCGGKTFQRVLPVDAFPPEPEKKSKKRYKKS